MYEVNMSLNSGLQQMSDISYTHWSGLERCHLILVTVNASDTESCCDRLADILNNRKDMVIFGMQRGVKSSSLLKDRFDGCLEKIANLVSN